MNTRTVQQLKKELLTKKENLLHLQTSNTEGSKASEVAKDLVDRSEIEGAWYNTEVMSQHWKLELMQIDNALHRMDAGTFGICEECEDEIPVKRLRVRPDATLCLACQETLEREISHMARSNRGGGSSGSNLIQ